MKINMTISRLVRRIKLLSPLYKAKAYTESIREGIAYIIILIQFTYA